MSAIILVEADDFEFAYILSPRNVSTIELRQPDYPIPEGDNYVWPSADAAMAWLDCHAKVGWSTRIISDD